MVTLLSGCFSCADWGHSPAPPLPAPPLHAVQLCGAHLGSVPGPFTLSSMVKNSSVAAALLAVAVKGTMPF